MKRFLLLLAFPLLLAGCKTLTVQQDIAGTCQAIASAEDALATVKLTEKQKADVAKAIAIKAPVPDAVVSAAEAGLANVIGEHQHAWIVLAGNPTHLEGPLYRACTKDRALWNVVEITADPDDPKRTPRVSAQWAREFISTYGRDSPWTLVNIFGRFPPSSINALLGPDDVAAAMKRCCKPEDLAGTARILGVDVARFGLDASMLARRRGLQAAPLLERRDLTSVQGAGFVAQVWNDFDQDGGTVRADGCFIDDTGGYGAGWIDQLGVLGRTPVGVGFARSADDARYFNKRTEIIFRLADWIKRGGCLPDDPLLAAELTAHSEAT